MQSGGEVTRVETTVLETEADPEVRTHRGNGAAGGGGDEVTIVKTTVLETEEDPAVRTRRGNGVARGGGGSGSDVIDGDGVRDCSEYLVVLKMALRGLTGMAAHGHTVVALTGRGTWG